MRPQTRGFADQRDVDMHQTPAALIDAAYGKLHKAVG